MHLPIARIALPVPVPELFDYAVPAELDRLLCPGMRVRVPFGPRQRIGYLIERAEESRHTGLKSVAAALDETPVLDTALLELLRWTADYYLAPLGEVIEAALPSGVRRARVRRVRWARLTSSDASVAAADDPGTDKRAGAASRARLLEHLRRAPPEGVEASRLLAATGTSDSTLRTLVRRGSIELFEGPATTPARAADEEIDAVTDTAAGPGGARPDANAHASTPRPAPYPLSDEQARAVAAVCDAARAARYETFLLCGVTGSGKTEVYLQCIQHVLASGGGALVLLPEIALTPQTVARFRERLGHVAVLHSMLPDGERAATYQELRAGRVRVAIGARSAVFAPLPRLGLIVVDECHESSYKQEATPRYHASDVAVMRASQLGIPCLLGSATPSLESLHNARQGRFTRLDLAHRVTGHALPEVTVIDRRLEPPPPRGAPTLLLSEALVHALRLTVARGEQALLFLNRRGFARHLHCPRCGFALQCPNCSITLTHHKRAGSAQCHYCGVERTVPERCPDCQSPGLRQRAPGTERIEDVLAKVLPDVPVGRLDRDTASTRTRMEEILADFREGRTRILVGTQMVAKGHDIPGVTLVGVVDADVALHLPDFRAAERTAQLICQVAGRAGRGDRPGRVFIQTLNPDHYAIDAGAAQDLARLLPHEDPVRRQLAYPPYGHLVRIVCEDASEERSFASATAVATALRAHPAEAVTVLGPAPAPLSRLRAVFRTHILVKSRQRAALRQLVRPLLGLRPRHATTRVIVDVDPQSLL